MPEISVALTDRSSNNYWIDADQDADEIESDIKSVLAVTDCSWCGNDEDGEHVGHDYEVPSTPDWIIVDANDFDPVSIMGSGYGLAEIAEIGQAIAKHGDAYKVWVWDTGDTDEAAFIEAFEGEYYDEEEYGKQFFNSVYGEEHLDELGLSNFVDWQGYGEWIIQDMQHCVYNDRLYVWRQ